MPEVTFIQPDGTPKTVQAAEGDSMMTTAVDNDVEGILGECGGGMSCATCHVFVEPKWLEVIGSGEDYEADVRQSTAVPATECSRLSCQIFVDDSMEGLVVTVAERQN